MGVVLAIQKGRCHSYPLLRVRLSVRWVPSEKNVADKDSRRWEEKSAPQPGQSKAAMQEEDSRLHQERSNESQRAPPESSERRSAKSLQQPLPLASEDASHKKAYGKGLQLMIQSSKKRMERARARQRKYGKKLRASRGEQSLLEMNSIKEPARKDYCRSSTSSTTSLQTAACR